MQSFDWNVNSQESMNEFNSRKNSAFGAFIRSIIGIYVIQELGNFQFTNTRKFRLMYKMKKKIEFHETEEEKILESSWKWLVSIFVFVLVFVVFVAGNGFKTYWLFQSG